jgi:hypothetical protein
MKLDRLKKELLNAQLVCPPDEYYARQRNLLYVLAQYIIESEEEKIEKEFVNDSRKRSSKTTAKR